MSRLVDNYNANECCKSLKEIKRSIKTPLKKETAVSSQILIRALQLKIAQDQDKKMQKKTRKKKTVSEKIKPFLGGEEREVVNAILKSKTEKAMMPKIRQQKVDQDVISLVCKNINEIVKDKNTSNDECRIFYEASYMIRTLWKRVEENEKLDEPLDYMNSVCRQMRADASACHFFLRRNIHRFLSRIFFCMLKMMIKTIFLLCRLSARKRGKNDEQYRKSIGL